MISTKVLTERLRKLTHYGLLNKQVFAEVPPRVEYVLIPYGKKLSQIIEQIRILEHDIKTSAGSSYTSSVSPGFECVKAG